MRNVKEPMTHIVDGARWKISKTGYLTLCLTKEFLNDLANGEKFQIVMSYKSVIKRQIAIIFCLTKLN